MTVDTFSPLEQMVSKICAPLWQ